jgi:hypothetical protein
VPKKCQKSAKKVPTFGQVENEGVSRRKNAHEITLFCGGQLKKWGAT